MTQEEFYKELENAPIDGFTWEEKYKNIQATQQFYNIFGGQFMGNSEGGGLMWFDRKNKKDYIITDDENTFWSKVLQSVEQGKNFFLTQSK